MTKSPMTQTKNIMAALLGMKPKQHNEMKIGKKRKKKTNKEKPGK